MIGDRSRSGPKGGPESQILSTVWQFRIFPKGMQNLYSSVRFRPAPPLRGVTLDLPGGSVDPQHALAESAQSLALAVDSRTINSCFERLARQFPAGQPHCGQRRLRKFGQRNVVETNHGNRPVIGSSKENGCLLSWCAPAHRIESAIDAVVGAARCPRGSSSANDSCWPRIGCVPKGFPLDPIPRDFAKNRQLCSAPTRTSLLAPKYMANMPGCRTGGWRVPRLAR